MVSLIDFFKLETVYVEKNIAQNRYDVCKNCQYFLPTTQCSKCLCFMKAKVKLSEAECPLGKWNKE